MGAIINGKLYQAKDNKGMYMRYGDKKEWVMQQNEDGTWSESVPLPFYGMRKGCSCGKKFWKESNYRTHYIKEHTDGKKYNRTAKGLTEVKL